MIIDSSASPGTDRSRDLARCSCTYGRAASAAQIFISPKATSSPVAISSPQVTRSSVSSRTSGPAAPASAQANGSACRGSLEACGHCRHCTAGHENLCLEPAFTGWDVDGGYADYALCEEAFAYAIPARFSDAEAAPLLCAGIIGYRALLRADLPPGGRLGIYGFGGSAHLAAQVAIAGGARVHVLTRSEAAQRLALDLGATSAAGAMDPPPEPLDSAILFAPVGDLVPPALEALDRGGTLAIAGIHLTDIPSLNYERHLFEERTLRSVTANTRVDGGEFLEVAERIHIRVETTCYPMSEANAALSDLAHDRVNGAAVLVNDELS